MAKSLFTSESVSMGHPDKVADQISDSILDALLAEDPINSNIRFCAVAYALRDANPDWILISGDLTDDGVGHDLQHGDACCRRH